MAVNPLARRESAPGGSPGVTINLDKMPPQNLEAEQSVLGSILLDNHALNRVLEFLSARDFYKDAHRRIFESMLELHERNEGIDLVTLTDVLNRRNDLERVGGPAYLTELVNVVPTAANVTHYAKIVHEKSLVRQLVQTATDIATRGYELNERIDDLLDYAEQKVFSISDSKISPSFYHVRDVVKDSFEMLEKRYEQKENVTGVPTGFDKLDSLTAGLHAGDLIIIAGRPGMGKTALALNIAQHAAINKRLLAAVFSLEMAREQLVIRMLCAEGQVDAHKLRSGYLGAADWPKLTAAAGRITEAPIFIDDTSALSVLELRAKARRLKREQGRLDLIIVDYLQLMRGRGEAENREREISEISRSLKALAKELRVPVIALSQLSRAVESRTERRPQLSDLRESGAIEQDADVVMFVYREELYRQTEENRNRATIIVSKQRNGPTGDVEVVFLKEFTRFVPYAPGY
ncbi:MAG: replicative DNA helicase [Nitrospirota bacterium]